MNFIDKDLVSVQESRILLERAAGARDRLAGYPQERLDAAAEAVYQAVSGRLAEFAGWAVAETGYGNAEDETRQLEHLLRAQMAGLRKTVCVGVLREDDRQRIREIGVPLGIAVVLCPAVSSAAAAVSLALTCMKSGNAAVFIPEARAARTVSRVLGVIRTAAAAAGYPEEALSCQETVSVSGCEEAILHKAVSVVINLGVKPLLPVCYHSGKPVFYGGTGPSPVFIERTAQIGQAVEDIIASRSFNYGMMPGAEQYVVADSQIAHTVRTAMEAAGAYFMAAEEEVQLLSFLCPGKDRMDEEYIGKPAVWLARQAGFAVPQETRVLVSEKHYIADRNPYARELRCPVLAFYIENDWMYACERCMNLLVQESKGHTLVIHSRDEEVIRQFAMKKPVARMLVNTQAVQGAMGLTTDFEPAVGLGGLTAGQGMTADNITPSHLVYVRRVGYGVPEIKDNQDGSENHEMIKRLLGELLRELNNQ